MPPLTLTEAQVWENFAPIQMTETAWGLVGVLNVAYACANDVCKELTLLMALQPFRVSASGYSMQDKKTFLLNKRILPESSSKPQPDYIPAQIREDYREACEILHLSPKASATLSRRCLQGMIRDFAKIVHGTLNQEIISLRKAVEDGTGPKGVSLESVEAIDHVRTIGNIGAHMEKDVALIIPIDLDEAELLIQLIGSLFEEWYVERHVREQRFAELARVAASKKMAKSSAIAPPPPAAPGP